MAYWIDKDGVSDFFYCSECDYKAHYLEVDKKCPKCGSIMNEETIFCDEDDAIELQKKKH